MTEFRNSTFLFYNLTNGITFLNNVNTCCRNNGDCEFMLYSIKDKIICSSSAVGAMVVFLLSHSKPKASTLIYIREKHK